MPSPKSVRNLTSTVNGEPGFFTEVFKALSTLNPDDKQCCLMFDAMSIKKQGLFDEKIGKFIGNCDMGNALEIERSNTAATEALVFMLVSLNGKWKLPVGYVLQNKITATVQAELVKTALNHSHKAGLKVWGVTCDGAYANLSTMKILGCKIGDNYEEIQCWFNHSIDNSRVYYIPDACHMLKLTRNTLGNNHVLESNTGFIKWEHITNIYDEQNKLTLKFANKISMAHVYWTNNKMKVKYAAQTLSSSTADTLEYLNSIKYPKFNNVAATVEFCRAIDRIFDFLNSKSKFSKEFKSPIFKSNIITLENIITPLIKYLYTLKFKGSFLYTSAKKTFIIGFAIAVKSMLSIARELFVISPYFNYVLSYTFSQDHLELLFGRIRQRFGANNNPNVTQFKTAMKQILLKNAIKCRTNGNCNTFDDDSVGSLFEFKWAKKKTQEEFPIES